MKSGFIAVIGKSNVGKSSLVNRLVGTKVAIVSPKPQTTRMKTLGILNEENLQIAFIDTPGFVRPTSKLNQYMVKTIESAESGVDGVLFVIDGEKGISEQEIKSIKRQHSPVIVAFNKMDATKYEKAFPELSKLNDLNVTVVPVSAKTGKNVAELKKELEKLIPEGPALFDTCYYTDKPVRFIVAEIIREKILWLLNDEIPHGVHVETIKFDEQEKKAVISADIICEKDSHKSIIIGKSGSMLKEIGSRARVDIQKFLGKKVYLELFVKIRENWRENENMLKNFGFDKKQV